MNCEDEPSEVAGYLRHKRAGEKACAICKRRWRQYYAKRSKR